MALLSVRAANVCKTDDRFREVRLPSSRNEWISTASTIIIVLLSVLLMFGATDVMVALNRAALAFSIAVLVFQEIPPLQGYYWKDYWKRMLMVGAPFITGPLTEIIVLYQAHEEQTQSVGEPTLSDSQDYTLQWFLLFALFLLLQPVWPYCVVSFRGPSLLYGFVVFAQMIFGYIFVMVIPPQMGDKAQLRHAAVLLVSWVVSFSIYFSLDRTHRSFSIKEQVHERFIATLSHDFGTPIVALQMAAKEIMNLLAGVDLAKAKPVIAGMDAALRLMKALKQKALDIASLQHNEQLTPRLAPVDLREVILVELPALFRYVPHDEAITVEYHVSDDVPETIVSDGWWISMVLLNFVTNAFKFTRKGYVRISAHMNGEMVRLTVTDTGAGISDLMKKELWQAFGKGRLGGNGIGLYHVQELVTFLGGAVGHQDNDIAGHGAIFWADLPLKPTTDAHGHVPKLPDQSLACLPAGLCAAVANDAPLLLVEDDLFIQDMTLRMLKSLDLTHVVLAINGVKALEVLQAPNAPKFALVLMDLHMPEMDGIECTRRIRAWERKVGAEEPLNIFALTANGDDAACQQDCKEAGFDGVLCKPLSREALTSHLRVEDGEGAASSHSSGQ